jgi:transcriptional regulator with XRE-family HTH domain
MLRTRRKAAHVEALPAARAAGIEITVLDDIESGRTRPAATVLAALLKCYGVTPAEFLPPRPRLVTTTSGATSDEVLRGYVDAVRKWRKSGRQGKLHFRENDLLALGKVLGTDPDEIERRLIAITGCSPVEARLLRKRFLAALVTIPVAAGLIGAAVPTAAGAASLSATAAPATTVLQGTVRPGSLSLKVTDPKLGAVQADGSIPLTVGYLITDARGSGAGWSVQATFTSTDATAYPTVETLHNVRKAYLLCRIRSSTSVG